MSDLDSKWLTEQTLTIVALAARNAQWFEVDQVIERVGERYGDRGAYSLACSMAACIGFLDGYVQSRDGEFFALEVTSIATGEHAQPEDLPGGGDLVAGMRFLTAWLNGDVPMTLTMFHTTPGPVFVGLVMLLGAADRDLTEQRELGEGKPS